MILWCALRNLYSLSYLISGSIRASENSMPMATTFDPVSIVLVSVGVHLVALAMMTVAVEITLIAGSVSLRKSPKT